MVQPMGNYSVKTSINKTSFKMDAKKYLASALQKISQGRKADAVTDLDMAEMEIDMLDSIEEMDALRAELEQLKTQLQSSDINPKVREDVLNSLQRRAENVKMRLQAKDIAKYEIQDFEQFFRKEESYTNLTSEDKEKIEKQIAGFKKLSEKYSFEEVLNDIKYVFKEFKDYYEQIRQAFEQKNEYEFGNLLDRSAGVGRRFEEAITDLEHHELISQLVSEFKTIKQEIGQLFKLFTDHINDASKAQKEQEEALRRAEMEEVQGEIDRFYHLVQQIPPPPIKEENRLIGRIIFSQRPIIIGKEDLDLIRNHFHAGDQVFGMAYFADSRKNIGFEKGVRVTIGDIEDGRGFATSFTLMENFTYEPSNENQHATIYDLDIFVGHEDAWDKELTAHFLQFLSIHLKNAPQSPYGDNSRKVHKFQVELEVGYQTVARGIFTYDLTQGHEHIHQLYASHKEAHLKAFKLPESKRNDPELAEKLRQVMEAEGVHVKKVVFSTADWGIVRHELSGVVLRRTIWAYIVYLNNKGEFHYDDVHFAEEFVGNEYTGTIRKLGYGTANGQILEENL